VAEVFPDLMFNADLFFKQIEIVHASISLQVSHRVIQGVDLLHVWNEDAMNLGTQVFFGLLADRCDNVLCEGRKDVLFVVVDCNLRRGQVLNVLEHVKWVRQSHQIVVQLV
jgi:hypothetical protein